MYIYLRPADDARCGSKRPATNRTATRDVRLDDAAVAADAAVDWTFVIVFVDFSRPIGDFELERDIIP